MVKATESVELLVSERLRGWGGSVVFLALDPLFALPLTGLGMGSRALALCWNGGPAIEELRAAGVSAESFGGELEGERCSSRLLAHPEVRARIEERLELGPVGVVAFKPDQRLRDGLAAIAPSPELSLLAPPVGLARRFENKLRFAGLVAGQELPLPASMIVLARPREFEAASARLGLPFVAQFGASYSGAGTALISNEADFEAFVGASRPGRKIKLSGFVKGRSVTFNGCVTTAGTVVGAAIEQLTGWPELTPYALGSCGNHWSPQDLAPLVVERAQTAVVGVGQALEDAGYLGHFGVDLVIDAEGRPYVIECNPRFTASLALDDLLSRRAGEVSLFQLHVLSHLGFELGARALRRRPPVELCQLILRQQGAACERGALAWRVLEPQRPSREATTGLAGFLAEQGSEAALLLSLGPGRRAKAGQELARLVLPGPLTEARRRWGLEALRASMGLLPFARRSVA